MDADASELDREPDICDNEEEYVGVDDEHIYRIEAHAQTQTQPHQNAQPPKINDHSSDNLAAEGGIPLEAQVNDADPQEVIVIHDPENPKIERGSKFPDIIAFRKAIRHYAAKEGFEFTGLKTDHTRFIAHCAEEGCPWRIHASKVYGERTIEVIHSSCNNF